MRLRNVPSILIALALAACGVCAWIFWPFGPAPVSRTQTATTAPEVRQVEKVAITPPVVKAYAPKAKARLKLPAAVQVAPSIYALTASQVKADDRPHTIITTLDEDTGEVETYDRPDPLPWLAPETRGELGISYGLRDGHPMGRLSVRQNLLQIKSLRLGSQASIDQDGQWFAGVGVWYRW